MPVAPPVTFVIDAQSLHQLSRKPRHLEKRMSEKKRAASPAPSSEGRSAGTESSSGSADASPLVHHHGRADSNRKALLQQRREQCAERVRRAKDIAKKQSRSREMSSKRLRSAIQERQWTSDFRRQMLLKVPRSKLLDETTVTAELIRTRLAVKRIQRWWKVQAVQSLVRQLETAGVSTSKLSAMSIEELMSTIQSASVIKLASRFLLATKKATRALARYRIKNPTKIFLSAFMIVYHPEEMMPEMNDEQKNIKKAAVEMLNLLDKVMSDFSQEAVGAFGVQWHSYHVLFEEWKAHDTEKLLAGMTEHFMELERLWESVRGQFNAEQEWKPRIDMQQKNIKAKVMRIGGKPAMLRLLTLQKEFRGDVAMTEESGDDSHAGTPQRQRHDSVTASAFESSSTEEVVPSPVATPKQQRTALPQQSAAAMEQVASEFGSGLTNELLAHELIMDPDFELKPNKDSLEARIAAMAKKAFFDKVREENDSKHLWATPVLADIREQLLGMVPETSKVHQEIGQILDMEHVDQQLKSGVFDMHNTLRFISGKMLQLCAPVRDASIRKLAELNDVPAVMEAMLVILEDMKLDLANYRLQSLRPHLMKQAVEYEQAKFKDALETKKVTLEKTTEWLQSGAKSVQEVASARNPQNIDIPENRVRFDAVYFDAFLSLLFAPEPVARDTVAETLQMDADRMFSYQNELQALTVVAALAMLTKNFVPEIRDDATALKKLKDELLVLLQAADTTVENLSLHIVSLVDGLLSRHQKSVSEEQKQLIRTMVDKTLSYKDTVYLLLNRRIRDAIRVQLTTGKFRKDTNTGLDVVMDELMALSRKIFIMARHNRDVYASWYDGIIRGALNA
jgi:hypothetical protein